MANALDIAQIGMSNDLLRLQVTSHNLANSGTAGFKRDIAITRAFDEQLASQMTSGAARQGLGGLRGSPTVERVTDPSTGVFRYTGNALDIGIEGEGYLEIVGPGGIAYSREGSLSLDTGGRLVNAAGMAVNGVDGEIRLNNTTPRIDGDGRIWQGEDLMGQLKVVHFADPSALMKMGSGLYVGAPGTQTDPASRPGIRQGYLEASNVPVMDEMVRMIEAMRQFESTQRIAKSYDDMIDSAVRTIAEF